MVPPNQSRGITAVSRVSRTSKDNAAKKSKIIEHESSSSDESEYVPGEPKIDTEAVKRDIVNKTVVAIETGQVKDVSVPNKRLNDSDAKAIAHAMCTSKSRLQTLRLINNEIGDAGATALAEAARKSKTLTSMHLSGNKIGPAGRHALLQVLGESDLVLKKLELGTLADNQVIDMGVNGLWVNESRQRAPSNLAYSMHTYEDQRNRPDRPVTARAKGTGEHLRLIKMLPKPPPFDPHQDADYPDEEASVSKDEETAEKGVDDDTLWLLIVGDRVRVRESVKEPTHGWGKIKSTSVGTIVRIVEDLGDAYVNFEEEKSFGVKVAELELVESELAVLLRNQECTQHAVSTWERCDGDEFAMLCDSLEGSPITTPREERVRDRVNFNADKEGEGVQHVPTEELILTSLKDAHTVMGTPLVSCLLVKLPGYRDICTYVCLSGLNLSAANIKDIGGVLRGFPKMAKLDLSNNPLGNNGALAICATFKNMTTALRSLTLRNDLLTGPGARYIIETFAATMARIDLSESYLTDDALRPLLASYTHGHACECVLENTEVSPSMLSAVRAGYEGTRDGKFDRCEPSHLTMYCQELVNTAQNYRAKGAYPQARHLCEGVGRVIGGLKGMVTDSTRDAGRKASALLEELNNAASQNAEAAVARKAAVKSLNMSMDLARLGRRPETLELVSAVMRDLTITMEDTELVQLLYAIFEQDAMQAAPTCEDEKDGTLGPGLEKDWFEATEEERYDAGDADDYRDDADHLRSAQTHIASQTVALIDVSSVARTDVSAAVPKMDNEDQDQVRNNSLVQRVQALVELDDKMRHDNDTGSSPKMDAQNRFDNDTGSSAVGRPISGEGQD